MSPVTIRPHSWTVMRWMLLPLVATLAIGCSGDAETATLDEWAAAVCESRAGLASLPTPASLADLEAFERVTDGFDDAVANLDGIRPPESARDYQRDLLRLYRGIVAAQRDFIGAATDGDAAAVSAATIEYQAQLERVFGEVDPDSLTTELENALRDAGCES